MAAPPNKTIGNLGGKWVQNRDLSDSVEPALAIQGINWLVRKAVTVCTVTLLVKQYVDDEGKTHIDIDQVATGGVKGTSEKRIIDFQFREHSDWLFGPAKGQSKFVTPDELRALVAEGSEARTKGWVNDDFLAQGFIESAEEATAPEGKTFLYNHVESVGNGWTATQAWGFELIGGERHYTRHVCVAKGDQFASFKFVFDWNSEL
ncbi:hypothetical protein F5Y16DRAFT_354883 [Xylariaceae sp. FL0255]|nr:hypothetical protein F5Y16DRAFT_354883 [Xylariaceae sp. FL0255]